MFERIISLVRQEKVSLFIGAGFSLEANAPSVRMLCDAILSQFDNDQQRKEHEKDPLADLANYFVEEICCGSRNSLIEILQEQFSFTPAKMDDHKTLAKIPHFHNIFTTNYDTLLEDSYDKKECQVIRKDADCAYIDNAKPVKIFKIHGDFMNQDFVVITKRDYNAFFINRTNQQMWNFVTKEFLTKHILFIGYSLADDNIIDIIKNISDAVNKNQKDMFLIAPGINVSRQRQLKKMNVHYYNDVAANFLNELTKALDANISSDFRHHKVSAETFSRYCYLHNINPEISLQNDGDNKIVNYKSIDGNGLQQEVKMTLDPKIKELFENIDFEKNGVLVKDAQFPRVPYYKLSGKDLLKCTYSVNGIVMNDEISSILIGPVEKKLPLTIRIPSRDFMEKVDAKSYSPRDGKIVITFDCNIYETTIQMERKHKDAQGTHLNFTFNFIFRDQYTNNNEAIKWIDFICAFYSNEDVLIKEISDVPFNIHSDSDEDKKNKKRFDDIKEYYENIKKIEMHSEVSFTTYHAFNKVNHRNSCIVLSYLLHQSVNVKCNDEFDFTEELRSDSDFVEHAKKNHKILLISSEKNQEDIIINERHFPIAYAHNIFEYCIVKDIEEKDDGFTIVKLHYGSTSYKTLFSNKPVNEEFPDLKMLYNCNNSKATD